MWMPEETVSPLAVGGASAELTGTVELAPQVQVVQPPGLFGGKAQQVTLFRLRTDAGQVVNCRFEEQLSGMMDRGDRVHVRGAMEQGVFQVTHILDAHGALIGRSGCFVATVAFGDADAPEVECLRRFRDEVLQRTRLGRAFISVYWRVGPWLARRLRHRPRLRGLARDLCLTPLCRLLSTRGQDRTIPSRTGD